MKTKIQLSDHFTYGRLLRFTLPSIVMMVFTSIYTVVDGFFISNFAGKTAFASLNLIYPFLQILGGVGFMIGTGGTALVSRCLGAGERDKALRYFSMMVELTLILGVGLTTVGLVFMEPIARALGATEEMMADCVLYGRIVIAFNTAFMFQNVFQSFLIAAEKPRLGLAATVSAGLTNMVLDALFVGVLHVGFVRLEARPLLQACGNGASELMTNISGSISAMVYNFQLLKFLGEDGVSAYGVIMYVGFFFIAMFIGYAIGSAPIISYHFGAQNKGEMQNMFRKSITLMVITGVAMSVGAFFLSGPFSRLFVGYDAGLYELTVHAFRLYSPAFLCVGLNIFTSSMFTALNDGTVSAAISFLRTLILQIAAILMIPAILGIDGLWLATFASEACALLVCLSFILANRKKYGYA